MSKTRGLVDEVALLRSWTDWNSRSRGEYLEAILRLPPVELRKDRGGSFGSIQDIFLHVIEDYIWWFENVPQGRLSEFEQLVGRDAGEQELRDLTRRVERSVHEIMDPLTPQDLGRPYSVRGTSGDGRPVRDDHVPR